MAERSQNLQDLFLNSVRKQKISLTIFLINGVKLTGIVTSSTAAESLARTAIACATAISTSGFSAAEKYPRETPIRSDDAPRRTAAA